MGTTEVERRANSKRQAAFIEAKRQAGYRRVAVELDTQTYERLKWFTLGPRSQAQVITDAVNLLWDAEQRAK